jgi:UPF0716 protein FxsA
VLLLLVLAFLLLPLAELWVIFEIGHAIGIWPTLALLAVDSILGAMLLRRQGKSAWRRFNMALSAGRVPAREVMEGTLILIGGALLLTPGFITDGFGLALLLPPTRRAFLALLGRLTLWRIARRGPGPVKLVGLFGPAGARQYTKRRARKRYDYEGSAVEQDPPTKEPQSSELLGP